MSSSGSTNQDTDSFNDEGGNIQQRRFGHNANDTGMSKEGHLVCSGCVFFSC